LNVRLYFFIENFLRATKNPINLSILYYNVSRIFKFIKGCRCKFCHISDRISKASKRWLDELGVERREVKLNVNFGKRKFIRADGFDPKTNTVYEFLGDFWHGNPRVYNQNSKNPVSKKIFGQLYNQTLLRFEKLKTAGYNIVYVWEKDFKVNNQTFMCFVVTL
jgi:hypothetical protein